MKKSIHYEPSPGEISSYKMQVSSDTDHMYYRIHLSELTEDQRRRLGAKFGVSLRILEDEPHLTLSYTKGV